MVNFFVPIGKTALTLIIEVKKGLLRNPDNFR